MCTNRMLICAVVALSATPVIAQSGRFVIPSAGYVYDSGRRSIRPIVGVRGSSYLGAAILTDVDAAWISPGGKWAFVTRAGRSAFVSALSESAASDALIVSISLVAWSRDASFAALYSSSTGLLQRVRLAGGQVAPDNPVDLSSWGTATALAIDSSGRIAFGIAGGGVHVMEEGSSPSRLLSMARPAAVAFGDNDRLYAVDAATGRIAEFATDLSPSEFAVVASPEGTVFDPVGVAISGSGAHLALADRGSQSLFIYETATHSLTRTVQLDLPPSGMERLGNGATFVLNRPRAKEWLLVLDATEDPAVYFVPAGEEEAR